MIDPTSFAPLPDRGGRIVFRTASGSRYEIDFARRRWARLEHSPESVDVRTADGALTGLGAIEVGRSVLLFGPPLTPGADVRVIETTPVVEIELDEA